MEDKQFANAELGKVVSIAKEKGYKVFTFESDGKIKQVFFENESGQIGTCQEFYGGIQFSTMHYPLPGIGSGFGSLTQNDFHNPDDIDICFMFAPSWVNSRDRARVIKYDSFDDYLVGKTILKYYEVK